jgi:predicted nucleic acid binding AN1-type Zn finger protein
MERCSSCRKKVAFVIKCKCERVVCIAHRDPEDHECTFDYRKQGTEQLEKQNPVVKSPKLTYIE